MAKDLKTGGRKKGTPNKLTKDLRTTIIEFINNNIDEIQINFNHLEPKDKLYFMERLFKYLLPIMNDNSYKNANINNIIVDTIFNTNDYEPVYKLPNNFNGVDSLDLENELIIRLDKP